MSEARGKPEIASLNSEPGANGRTLASSASNSNQHPNGHYRKWNGGQGSDEEESNHYMSEPSLSEEGDSTTDQNMDMDRSLLSDGDDDTDDRATPPPPPPGPPPPRTSQSSAASTNVASPGNTSLSSWESHFRPRHPNHLVRIHFSPEPYTTSPFYHYQAQHLFPPQNERSSFPIVSRQSQPQLPESTRQQPSQSAHSDIDMSYSVFSMSTMSSVSSSKKPATKMGGGALAQPAGIASTLNAYGEDGATSQSRRQTGSHDAVPSSRTHRRISSVETELIGNTSDAHIDEENDVDGGGPDHYSVRDDSSLMLNLSVLGDDLESSGLHPNFRAAGGEPTNSSGGGARKNYHSGESNHNHMIDDHSDHHHHCAADDEQTEFRPPRRRTSNATGGKPLLVHRRTRSGDSAAAALATGGTNWIGMFKDKIPMPGGDDDDDDEEDHDEKKDLKQGSPENPEQNCNTSSRKRNQLLANGNDKIVFALGATEATASRAAARRQRREIRQQQRTLGEKAAAAARQRRIQKQYQEWSHSPLWTMQYLHHGNSQAGHVDSSETNSLGSVPSTVGLQFPRRVYSTGSNLTLSSGDREGTLYLRNSLDTLSSGMSPPGGSQQRHSVGTHNSFFSWVSNSSNSEVGGPLSFSSRGQGTATLKVAPKWSPQQSAASPIPSQRKQLLEQQQQQQQQQRHYQPPSSGVNLTTRSASQEAFRRYDLDEANASEPQEAFMRYLRQQQLLSVDHDSFRVNPQSTQPHNKVALVEVPSGSSSPPFTMSISSQEHFTCSQHSRSGSSSRSSGTTESEEEEEDDDDDQFECAPQDRVHQTNPNATLIKAERSAENELLNRGSLHHVLRSGAQRSPFTAFGKVSGLGSGPGPKKFDRKSFLPKTSIIEDDDENYPTYRCPRCETLQREFFTVDNAPRQYETASSFLAFSFVVYVIASLYIFGLEEGWPALDCIYFAVITLTTAGLGDFVPTSNFNKIICSIFIYFGVACIGLLLGSYIAAMLDESSRRQARENRINACPNCARLQNIRDAAERRAVAGSTSAFVPHSLPGGGSWSERTIHGSTRPFSFEDSELFHPNDIDYQSGKKKVKRRHPRSEIPASHSPPLTPDPTLERSSPRQGLGSAGELSPFVTRSKSSASSSPMTTKTLDEIPEEGGESTKEKGKGSVKPNVDGNMGVLSSLSNTISSYGTSTSLKTPESHLTAHQFPAGNSYPELHGSPMTQQILGRQSHTRHTSIDMNGGYTLGPMKNFMVDQPASTRKYAFATPSISQTPTITENAQFIASAPSSMPKPQFPGVGCEQDDSSYSEEVYPYDGSSVGSSGSYDSQESDGMARTKNHVKTAKYVFLTLKQALVNSMVIIAVGCLGFWFIEGFSVVDSWYFTTVLLTTVGYGDIVPVTKGGKLFATIYILVAGTILLNNMSLISMIPLELRKRRIERAVLTQFGDLLDDDALRELASGPLIHRLHLSRDRTDGLDECTREMFALAMLVRLGKVTEEDIAQTFGAFNRLDVNGDGVLNSRSIIAGMIHKSRIKSNLSGMRQLNSTTLPKTPAMYIGNQDSDYSSNPTRIHLNPNAFTPPPTYDAHSTMVHNTTMKHNTTETSALLQYNSGYNSMNMLSRSK